MGKPPSHCPRWGHLEFPLTPKYMNGSSSSGVAKGALRFTRILSIAGRCPLQTPDDMVWGMSGGETTQPLAGWSTWESPGACSKVLRMKTRRSAWRSQVSHISQVLKQCLSQEGLPSSRGTSLEANLLLDNSLDSGLKLYLGNRHLIQCLPCWSWALLPYALYPLQLNPW